MTRYRILMRSCLQDGTQANYIKKIGCHISTGENSPADIAEGKNAVPSLSMPVARKLLSRMKGIKLPR